MQATSQEAGDALLDIEVFAFENGFVMDYIISSTPQIQWMPKLNLKPFASRFAS
jgi:hypothetical protein